MWIACDKYQREINKFVEKHTNVFKHKMHLIFLWLRFGLMANFVFFFII